MPRASIWALSLAQELLAQGAGDLLKAFYHEDVLTMLFINMRLVDRAASLTMAREQRAVEVYGLPLLELLLREWMMIWHACMSS